MSSKGFESRDDTIFSVRKSVKWFEGPIQKFNTAVPHFVDLLKTHQNNIQKLRRLEQWEDIQKENISANQIINQLNSLLSEMENLRNQVIETDMKKFDKLINISKQSATSAIISFQEVSSKPWVPKNNQVNQVTENFKEDETRVSQARLLVAVADLSEAIEVQEHRAAEMEKLHENIEDVHYIFHELSQIVHEQGEAVEKVETHVETTHHNILQGEKMLCQAAKYKASAYPLLGALIGSIMGGPVGLVAGFKAGGLTATALGCGFLGFTGGKMLKGLDKETIDAAECHLEQHL